MRGKTNVDKILDVKGLLCPVPTVMTGKTLKEMKKGESLQVLTNDHTTRETITDLCNQMGYELIDIEEEEGILSFLIRK